MDRLLKRTGKKNTETSAENEELLTSRTAKMRKI